MSIFRRLAYIKIRDRMKWIEDNYEEFHGIKTTSKNLNPESVQEARQ